MLKLTDLPEEILLIIIRKLDLISIHSVYNTCRQARRIVELNGTIKIFDMSYSTMATIQTFKLDLFKSICSHLQELNLCGVHDLTRSSMLPIMKRLKVLKTLDVSYTDINITDFIDFYGLCPTIKNITINFVFERHAGTKIRMEIVNHCCNVFEQLDNVHFVGTFTNLLCNKLTMDILSKAKLNTLQFTISHRNIANLIEVENEGFTTEEYCFKCKFSYFNICLPNWKDTNDTFHEINLIPLFSSLELKKYEFIIILMKNYNEFKVYVSSIFVHFFDRNFRINAECLTELDRPLFGNAAVMIWNKETHKFNSLFFYKLFNKIKQYFPQVCSDRNVQMKFDWFYIIPKPSAYSAPEVKVQRLEQRRQTRQSRVPKAVLNYDSLFKEKNKLELSIIFETTIWNSVNPSLQGDYLKKLTFLSLTGSAHFNYESFRILFICCCNLVTFNFESSVFPCISAISMALPLSTCLKNFRIVAYEISYKVLFTALSQCKTLENIYVIDNNVSPVKIECDPSIMIEKLDKLYNLYIRASMGLTSNLKKIKALNETRRKFKRNALNIMLFESELFHNSRYNYDPCISVFNLNPIKPIICKFT